MTFNEFCERQGLDENSAFAQWSWKCYILGYKHGNNRAWTTASDAVKDLFKDNQRDLEEDILKMESECSHNFEKQAEEKLVDNDEEIYEIPGVIFITDEIKKEYPELKNLKMIQKEPSDYMTWNESMDYAKKMTLGGFDDWRLPTIDELRGIFRAKQALGITDDDERFWSSTEYSPAYAMRCYFSNGDVYYCNKSHLISARCVR